VKHETVMVFILYSTQYKLMNILNTKSMLMNKFKMKLPNFSI